MQATDTQSQIELVAGCGPLRVWSVLVTIMGDLCVSREDRVNGKVLQHLTDRMGLTAQAVRVALHRLRRDGWVESARTGRESVYWLSAMGWRETQAVRGRIYGTEDGPDEIRLVIAPPSLPAQDFAAALPADALTVTPRTALLAGAGHGAPPESWVVRVTPGALPGWLAESVADTGLRQEHAALTKAVDRVMKSGPAAGDIVSTTVLRLLILHHWRRLRLRQGNLPDLLLGPGWEGAKTRAAVIAALERFPRPAITALSGASGPDAAAG